MLTAVIVTAFLLALYFPAMLFFRSDWNANGPIRALFGFSIVVALVLGLAAARVLGWHLPEWFRGGSYTLILVGLLVQDITLTKTQNSRSARLRREKEQERRNSAPPPVVG